MNPISPRMREILEAITPEHPLCYGGDGHWFFSGGNYGPKGHIHASTGFSLLSRKYIKARPRTANQPLWLSKHDITPEGKAALT